MEKYFFIYSSRETKMKQLVKELKEDRKLVDEKSKEIGIKIKAI